MAPGGVQDSDDGESDMPWLGALPRGSFEDASAETAEEEPMPASRPRAAQPDDHFDGMGRTGERDFGAGDDSHADGIEQRGAPSPQRRDVLRLGSDGLPKADSGFIDDDWDDDDL